LMTTLMGCQCQGLGFGESWHLHIMKGDVKSFPTHPQTFKSTKYWLVRSVVQCMMRLGGGVRGVVCNMLSLITWYPKPGSTHDRHVS
jgi:hypothetical protein